MKGLMENQQDIMNMSSNPFLSLLGDSQSAPQSGAQGGGMPAGLSQMMGGMSGGMTAGQGQTQQPTQPQAGGAPGEEMEEEESQFNKGQNPDRGKPLLTAIQALENYIVSSTERDEILTARGIISLLTKLVAKDQENMMQE